MTGMDRPRRLRRTPALRRLVAETTLESRHLVLPMFVADGLDEPREIGSMPGVHQHSMDSLRKAAVQAVTAGVGSLASDPEGILNRGLRALSEEVGDATVVMADTCLDEFTDHGHCGVLSP